MEVAQGAVGARMGRPMGWRSPPNEEGEAEEEEGEEAVEMEVQVLLKEHQWLLRNRPTCRTCC